MRRWGASLADRPHGYSLLHLAAGVGALASVTFLLESGADANGELATCWVCALSCMHVAWWFDRSMRHHSVALHLLSIYQSQSTATRRARRRCTAWRWAAAPAALRPCWVLGPTLGWPMQRGACPPSWRPRRWAAWDGGWATVFGSNDGGSFWHFSLLRMCVARVTIIGVCGLC